MQAGPQGPIDRMGRLWRTVRPLKPRQVWGRLAFRLARPVPQLQPGPARRAAAGPWAAPAQRAASLVGPQRWRLLGLEGELAELGWCGPQAAKLWRYNQHYFDDLNAHDAAARRAWHTGLMAAWLAQNPPGRGDGWEPYPTALRIVNWVKWWAGGAPATPAALQSLAVQVRWLRRRLEWHLLGNHLFANAKALVMAGLFFEGPEPDAWLAEGLRILDAEIPEQILGDGGQFERSPMYHALALEDMLDLVNALQAWAPAQVQAQVPTLAPATHRLSAWRQCAAGMLHWLRCMSHPDGGIAFFNDGAHGVAPANDELERYAAALGITADAAPAEGVTHLADSGYVRLAWGDTHAWLDVAPVGPDYLPGHAHADTLSFELSFGAQRVVVNGGTSRYGLGPEREFERSTAAHSTVQVAGQNSSEVWSGFRVGRRARVVELHMQGRSVEAAHDGYRHLPGAPLHRRRWVLRRDGLIVTDAVTPGQQEAVARFHLAPGLELHADGGHRWNITRAGQPVATVDVLEGTARALPSRHAPAFGSVLVTHMLEVTLVAGRACTQWRQATACTSSS